LAPPGWGGDPFDGGVAVVVRCWPGIASGSVAGAFRRTGRRTVVIVSFRRTAPLAPAFTPAGGRRDCATGLLSPFPIALFRAPARPASDFPARPPLRRHRAAPLRRSPCPGDRWTASTGWGAGGGARGW